MTRGANRKRDNFVLVTNLDGGISTRQYFTTLREISEYLGVSYGSIRCLSIYGVNANSRKYKNLQIVDLRPDSNRTKTSRHKKKPTEEKSEEEIPNN